MLRTTSCLTAIVCTLAATTIGCGDKEGTDASQSTFEVLDPRQEHYGKSYSEWNAEWYKWLYGIEFDSDCHVPLDDPTGEYCGAGQSGDVFFLAGSITPTEVVVVREECTVPAGKAVFFPILNTTSDNGGVPEDMLQTPEESEGTVAGVMELVEPENLIASVHGEAIPDLERFETDVVQFSYDLAPEPNFYTCMGAIGVTGTIDPAFAAGYYVMLAPLSPGTHEIRFGLDQPDNLWSIDITYQLKVE